MNTAPEAFKVTNKLKCYIRLSWQDLTEKNTLAYLGPFISYQKMKCCEFGPKDNIHKSLFSL